MPAVLKFKFISHNFQMSKEKNSLLAKQVSTQRLVDAKVCLFPIDARPKPSRYATLSLRTDIEDIVQKKEEKKLLLTCRRRGGSCGIQG